MPAPKTSAGKTARPTQPQFLGTSHVRHTGSIIVTLTVEGSFPETSFASWHHALDTASSEEGAAHGCFVESYPLVGVARRCAGRYSVAGVGPRGFGQHPTRATTFFGVRHRLVRNTRRTGRTLRSASEQLPMARNVGFFRGLPREHTRPHRHSAKPPVQKRACAARIPRPGLGAGALSYAHRSCALWCWVHAL